MRPGDWCAVGLVAGAFAMDAALVEGGHLPISTCVRTNAIAKGIAIGIALHLVLHLPLDPISAIGRRYTAWRHL